MRKTNIIVGNKYELIKPIWIYRKGEISVTKLEEGNIVHVGWNRDNVFGIQLSCDHYQEHWQTRESQLTSRTTKKHNVNVRTKQKGEMGMITNKKELVNYLNQQTSLLEKLENEYAPLEATDAVKRLIDGETMAFLTTIDGHVKLYEVRLELETIMDMPRSNYRLFLVTPNGRYERGMDENDKELGRLLRKEWYTKIYPAHLPEGGY